MGLMYVLGGIMILAGIVMIAFPDITRSLDRFSNELEGVETKQGETYEMARIGRGLLMIVAGLVVLAMPAML